jgi:hypothetical protein
MESDIEGTVIGGFEMSANEKLREIDSYVGLPAVRGLPKVFLNDRLNFLCHFHSALFQMLTTESGDYPSPDSLTIILDNRKDWSNSPEIVLLETVIDRTIDSRTGVVKANPFRLPIIEPTMQLTPKIMHMSLDQLHREFEIEWFNTLKTMTTPKFQSKYESRKYRNRDSRRHSSSSGDGTNNGSQRTSSSGSNRAGRRRSVVDDKSSILSMFSR